MSGSPSGRRRRPLLALLPYLARYRTRIVIGSLMVLLTNAAAVVSPWILRNAIDDLALEITRSKLAVYAGLIVGASSIEGLFRFLMRHILIGVSRQVEFDLRNDLFEHLQKLSANFYQRYSTGDLMARATNDLNAVRSVLGPGIMYSLNTLFTTILTVGLLLSIEERLAVLTLIPLVLVSLSVKYFGTRIHDRFEQIQEQFSALTTLAQETLSGIRVIKAYDQEEAVCRLFSDANKTYLERSMGLVRIQGVYNPLLVLLLGLSSLGVLFYGGRLATQGVITVGDLVAFMAYLVMLTWPTIALGWVINVIERGSASMARINEIFDSVPSVSVEESNSPLLIQGNLRVTDLDFCYNGIPVLQGISFEAGSGTILAIVGSTGSGKTTLANLLCHLYPIPRGKVFIDGCDLNDIPLTTLRRSMGYVQQDDFLFSESIRNNVALGRPDATDDEISHVSTISHIAADIHSFPDQFETMVGERGITLSGGQKQRISIARALLVDPRILILDDSFSSVDTYTEEQILKRLQQEMRSRTVILISHRISTVKLADQILVMDAGRIVESGNHEELLSLGGRYRRLHEQQQLREELGIE